MTKKDYELIASILNEFGNDQEVNGFGRHLADSLSRSFISILSKENSAFDVERFAKDCGYKRYF